MEGGVKKNVCVAIALLGFVSMEVPVSKEPSCHKVDN